MDDNIEISRDKKNPTWVWVWKYKEQEKEKRIILDICGTKVICVNKGCEDDYINDLVYITSVWNNYKIIKEPTYRPIETLEDYIEATKDRKDLRAIDKKNKAIYDLSSFYSRSDGCGYFSISGYTLDSEIALQNCVWLDDRSPVGVKCS